MPDASVSAWSAETAKFADWKPYTNPDTGKTGWISDGGQVRYDDPRTAVAVDSHASAAAEQWTAGLEQKLPRGVWAKVKDKATTAAARAYLFALKADPVIQKALTVAGAILDTPADMAKLGYHPSLSSGTAHAPGVQDAIRNATGISTHLATTIGSHVLARALNWMKSRAAQMADAPGDMERAAAELAKLFNEVDEALGLPATSDPANVAASLRSIEAVKMADNAHEYGWVGAVVPEPLASQFAGLGEQIDAADLAGDGLETEPHVTILYGLHDMDPATVAAALVGAKPFTVTLVGASVFDSGQKGYDVVNAEAEAPELHDLNERLRELPHTNDYPDYKPHATIAYVKPGTGAGYAKTIGNIGQSFAVNELVYKDAAGNATVIPLRPAAEMADSPTVGGTVPVTEKTKGKPAGDEVSIAGKEGRQVVELIRASKAEGVKTFAGIVGEALKRFDGTGKLLNDDELGKLSDALAAVTGTAELLGRARVRELASRADGASKFADKPLAKFADTPPGIIATPEAAYSYFAALVPKLGVDPERFAGQQRRQAFTLAESANTYLTDKVKARILQGLATAEGAADVTAGITSLLEAAGVSPANPQYAEMVFRTNAMDSYQTGVYEEGRHSDVADYFPVWQYVGIDDERAGADHRPKHNKFYPATATFADVRGNRPFNCRCSLRWVDKHEWAELEKAGARVETEWATVT